MESHIPGILRNNAGDVSKPRILGTVAGAVAIAAGSVVAISRGEATPAGAADNPTEWLDVVDQDKPNCVELVVDAGTGETYEMEIDGKQIELVKSDIGANQDGRLWTNALRAPFESDDPEAEVKASLCEDAPFSVATANVLGNVVYQGKRLADTEAGKWLKPYADLEADELNDKAQYLLGMELEATDVDTHYERYQERAELAENLAAVLTNLNNEGLNTGATDVDVSYADESFVGVVGIPELVKKSGQFKDAEALMFAALLKGEECPTPIIGFNTGIGADGNPKNGDQRPETFVPDEECVVTTVTNPDGSTTTHITGSTTTTNPDGSTTTTSWRTSNTVTDNTTIEGPGAGGDPDDDNDPENNTTTSTTSTTVGPGPTTSTTQANSVTSTTLGECGAACE